MSSYSVPKLRYGPLTLNIKMLKIHDPTNFKGLIIAGDMNCCLTPLDKSTQIGDSSVDSLKCLVRELGVTDIWRTLNSTTRMYSHHNYASGTSSRSDYIFISNILCSLVKKSSMQKLPKIPDHKAVFLKIKSQLKRENGYWKLNVSLIGLAKYQEKVLQCIENTCSNYKDLVSKRVLWDLVKFRIKEMSINFSKTKRATIEISQGWQCLKIVFIRSDELNFNFTLCSRP